TGRVPGRWGWEECPSSCLPQRGAPRSNRVHPGTGDRSVEAAQCGSGVVDLGDVRGTGAAPDEPLVTGDVLHHDNGDQPRACADVEQRVTCGRQGDEGRDAEGADGVSEPGEVGGAVAGLLC